MIEGTPPAVRLTDVGVWRWDADAGLERPLLADVSWTVAAGEHWALVGPNGAGKSTLTDLIAARSTPSTGIIEILGHRRGRVEVARLHPRIGYLTSAPADTWRRMSALDVVVSGLSGSIARLSRHASADAEEAALGVMRTTGCAHLPPRTFGQCSFGERQRLLLARALVAGPALLILDEPTSALDLPGREAFLTALDAAVAGDRAMATITVSHRLEELPRGTDHALLMSAGRIVAAGPVEQVLTPAHLSRCFDVPIRVSRVDGRWFAAASD